MNADKGTQMNAERQKQGGASKSTAITHYGIFSSAFIRVTSAFICVPRLSVTELAYAATFFGGLEKAPADFIDWIRGSS
jgi:hypothetical protein